MKYLALFFIVILSASCKNDRDNIDVCYNDGIYKNGRCVCNSGFAGKNCETALRNKLLGNWLVRPSANTSSSQYTIGIQPNSAAKNSITIQNFQNYLHAIQAFVINDSLINIPVQQLQGKSITGTGYVLDHNGTERKLIISCVITDVTTGTGSVVTDTLQ